MKKSIVTLAVLTVACVSAFGQVPNLPTGLNGLTIPISDAKVRQNIVGHPVRLQGDKLLPWCSLDTLLRYSVNFLEYCPTKETAGGTLPWYVLSSEIEKDGSFHANQNNQGGNLYFAMNLYKRWYAYTGDKKALDMPLYLARQIMKYPTPKDWAWPDMPRTQDNTIDGVYDDEYSEPDKMAMVATAYVDLARITGDKQYIKQAEHIARVLMQHIIPGDDTHSPLPYRVNMKTGVSEVPYTANMIFVVKMFDELLAYGTSLKEQELRDKRQTVMDWILRYPMKTYLWVGYFEDVSGDKTRNVNQICPMETARYLIDHPEADINARQDIVNLIWFVKHRFGPVRYYGATAINEQDHCYREMSSHTSRYASVVAKWYGVNGDEATREEARSSTALCSYFMYGKASHDSISINLTDLVDDFRPWFSDAYFDFLPHILESMGELPELVPEGTDHLIKTTSLITDIKYGPSSIKYTTFDPNGTERLKLSFRPTVYADGKPLPQRQWSFGTWRGVDNVLIINREGVRNIEILKH